MAKLKVNLVQSEEDFKDLEMQLLNAKRIAFDTETTGLNPRKAELVGMSWATEKQTWYIPLAHRLSLMERNKNVSVERAVALTKKVIANTPEVWVHNLKYDMSVLHKYGVVFNCGTDKVIGTAKCPMLMAQLLGVKRAKLKILSKEILNREQTEFPGGDFRDASIEFARDYAGQDARNCFDIVSKMYPYLKKLGLEKVFNELEMPLVEVLKDMEMTGLLVEKKVLEEAADELVVKAERIQRKFMARLGMDFRLGQVKILAGVMFEERKLWPIPKWMKKGKGGSYSTQEKELIKIRSLEAMTEEGKWYLDNLLEWRGLNKMVTTFTNSIIAATENGRFHPKFKQLGAVTGRMSASRVHQIPRDSEGMPSIRRAFIAPAGSVLVNADASQIELRVLTHYSKDPYMLEVYHNNGDIHAKTAKEVGCVRQDAKSLNFGLFYGMQAGSLARAIGQPFPIAKKYHTKFFETYKGAKQFIDLTHRYAIKHGYVKMLTGRYRWFPQLRNRRDMIPWQEKVREIKNEKKDHGMYAAQLREAMNTKIQGCLCGNTRVWVKGKGYVRLETMAGQNVEVWDGERFATAKIVFSGYKYRADIEFYNGQQISGSFDHKYLTVNNLGNEGWKSLEDFSKKERIRLGQEVKEDIGDEHFVVPESSPTPHCKAPKGTWNVKRISFNMIEDKYELGLILGRLSSDGCVTKNKNLRWIVAEHEKEIKPVLTKILSVFGKVSVYVRKIKGKMDLYNINICSALLAREATNIKIKTELSDLLFTHKELLRGFLRGYTDGDGGITGDKVAIKFGKGKQRRKKAGQIQQAFLLFGIQSRLKSYNKGDKESTVVSIRKRDNEIFLKQIGFMNSKKQARLKELCESNKAKEIKGYLGRTESVKSIKEPGEYVPMYDVVNSSTGKFMANGLVVHNSASDILKIAMRNLYYHWKRNGMLKSAHMNLQVHDEIMVECDKKVAKDVMRDIQIFMETPVKLCIPMIAEPSMGHSWADTK